MTRTLRGRSLRASEPASGPVARPTGRCPSADGMTHEARGADRLTVSSTSARRRLPLDRDAEQAGTLRVREAVGRQIPTHPGHARPPARRAAGKDRPDRGRSAAHRAPFAAGSHQRAPRTRMGHDASSRRRLRRAGRVRGLVPPWPRSSSSWLACGQTCTRTSGGPSLPILGLNSSSTAGACADGGSRGRPRSIAEPRIGGPDRRPTKRSEFRAGQPWLLVTATDRWPEPGRARARARRLPVGPPADSRTADARPA